MSPTMSSPATAVTEVWLVEDHALYRGSVAALVERQADLTCPVAVGSVEEALAELDLRPPPRLVLMDIGLPGLSGIEGARQLRARAPETRVVMLTVHEEDEKVFAALCAGASGYLLKAATGEDLVAAVRQVAAGAAAINPFIAGRVISMFERLAVPRGEDPGLTAREREILALLVEGLAIKQIAARLGTSYHTVDSHVRNVYAKLHVHCRAAAVASALRHRLI